MEHHSSPDLFSLQKDCHFSTGFFFRVVASKSRSIKSWIRYHTPDPPPRLSCSNFPSETAVFSATKWARIAHEKLSARSAAFATGCRFLLLADRLLMSIVFQLGFGSGRRRRAQAGAISVGWGKALNPTPRMLTMVPYGVIGITV